MILAALLTALTLTVTPPADSLVSADSAISLLRHGGYTLMWRHTTTDKSTADEPGYPNTERYQQRNLSDRGVMEAKGIGMILKAKNVPIGDIITSPMYRTRETAQYAFGRVTATDVALISIAVTPEQKHLLLTLPASGTNRVIVTHHFVIEQNAPGVKPGDVAEGEIAVVKSDGRVLRTVAILKMADFMKMMGELPPSPALATIHGGAGGPPPTPRPVGPLVIPASLKAPNTSVAGEYITAFNSGDTATVRKFFESRVLPNPERTMAQRLETYAMLREALGQVAFADVDVTTPGLVIANVMGSTGRTAKISIHIETAAPYRATGISVEYQRGG